MASNAVANNDLSDHDDHDYMPHVTENSDAETGSDLSSCHEEMRSEYEIDEEEVIGLIADLSSQQVGEEEEEGEPVKQTETSETEEEVETEETEESDHIHTRMKAAYAHIVDDLEYRYKVALYDWEKKQRHLLRRNIVISLTCIIYAWMVFICLLAVRLSIVQIVEIKQLMFHE